MAIKETFENNTEKINLAKTLLADLSDRTGKYVWKKLTSANGTFIELVVSDISDAYPDGGTQDGCWYELFDLEHLTADATATADSILSPYTAYARGEKVVGQAVKAGSYVWSKDQKTTNKCTLTVSSWTPFTVTISGGSVTMADLAGLTINVVYKGDSSYYDRMILSSNGTCQFYRNGSLHSTQNYTLNGSTLKFSGINLSGYTLADYNFTYTTLYGTSYETIGYVVSNDSSEYPTSGTHTDGFRYVLLAEVASANVMTLSDGAYGEVETAVVSDLIDEVASYEY